MHGEGKCNHVDQKEIEEIKTRLNMDEIILSDMADLFKVFGDSTRMRIINALFKKDLCVCEIAEVLNMSDSSISHQLRILRHAKLVECTRDGKSIVYSLADNHVFKIFEQAFIHVTE